MSPLARALWAGLTLAACDVSRPVMVAFDGGRSCPLIPTELNIDSACDGRRCALTTRQDGCKVEFSLTECMIETLTATVGPDGELGFQPSRTLGTCRSATPRTFAEYGIICSTMFEACRYDLYPPAPRSDLTLEEVSLVSSPFDRPAMQEVEPLDDLSPLQGYLADSVLLDGMVWVATRAGTFGTIECGEPERAELVRVDMETLQITARETAPPCLALLAPDPSGVGRFLGVTAGAHPTVHRFDANGRTVAMLDVPTPQPGAELIPTGLLTDSSTTVALVLTTPALSSGWLVTLDARDLSYGATSRDAGARLRATSSIVDGRVYAADRGGGEAVVFDVRRARVLDDARLTVAPPRGSSDDTGFLYFHAPSGKLLTSATGRRGALWRLDPAVLTANQVRAVAYEAELVPWAITTWPGSTDVVAVGMMVEPQSYAATLARYSVSENRFLPGSTRIGQGVVRRLDVDGRGRLWALLSWSGRLVRITQGAR